MAVIVKQQIAQMKKWTNGQVGLPEDHPLDPATAIGYVHKQYPGGLKAFTAKHPDPGLTPEQKETAKHQGLGGPYWKNPHA